MTIFLIFFTCTYLPTSQVVSILCHIASPQKTVYVPFNPVIQTLIARNHQNSRRKLRVWHQERLGSSKRLSENWEIASKDIKSVSWVPPPTPTTHPPLCPPGPQNHYLVICWQCWEMCTTSCNTHNICMCMCDMCANKRGRSKPSKK